MEMGFGASMLDAFIKLALYYGHERAWNKLKFGLKR